MKKILILLGLGIVVFVPHALADGFTALAPIPGLTAESGNGSVIDSTTLTQFLNNLYIYAIGLSATLAVIEIIWGGLLYSTTDSVGNKAEGKEKIQMAILGLILVLSPALVFSIINPSILNLSLNLGPIKTLTAPNQDNTNAYTDVNNMTADQLAGQANNGANSANVDGQTIQFGP